jgi:Protein of unknown function (DUF3152)
MTHMRPLACLFAFTAVLASVTPIRTITYSVAARGVAQTRLPAFTAALARIYGDPRGWSVHGLVRWKQVASGGDLTVWLAAPDAMTSFSSGCSALWDCRVGRDVVINVQRWDHRSQWWPGAIGDYRAMIVNHETGHFLGLDHAPCPRAGVPAPLMMQQSKGPKPCLPNPWPLASEYAAAGLVSPGELERVERGPGDD